MKRERAKYLKEMEIGGILFCSLYSIFAGRLYELSGKGLLGVLFGSVNNSPWECVKPLLLSYLLWGILEALSLQPSIHRLTCAKTFSLYMMAAVSIGILLQLLVSPGEDAHSFGGADWSTPQAEAAQETEADSTQAAVSGRA